MENYSKLSTKMKEQIKKYCIRKTDGLDEHVRRSVIEIVFGMATSGTTLLSEISRCLKESIPVKKTVERLRRNLLDENLFQVINKNHLSQSSVLINNDTIIAIDDTDINKERAKVMEGLSSVHDGSTGEIVKGYNVLTGCLIKNKRKTVVPLISELYSKLEDGFVSRNKKRDDFLDSILRYSNGNGLLVFDRGFSDMRNLRRISAKNGRFTCRSIDREISADGTSKKLYAWAKELPKPFATTVYSIKNGKRINRDCAFTCGQIEIGYDSFWAVAMILDDHEVCVLLTNQGKGNESDYNFARKVIDQYGCRWSVEETIRFQKQQLDFENMRVRSLTALKSMTAIVSLASAFYATLISLNGRTKTLAHKLIKISRPIREEARFLYYRLAQGIQYLLQSRNIRPFHFGHHRQNSTCFQQLCFPGI